MAVVVMHTRSFHPDELFGLGGLGFHGDNRGFSDSTNNSGRRGNTSRIFHEVGFDLQAAQVTFVRCDSHESSNAVIPAIATGAARIAVGPVVGPQIPDLPPMRNDYSQQRKKPRATIEKNITAYRTDGDQSVSIDISYAGKNFAFYGADSDTGHYILGGAEGSHEPAPANDDRWFWQRYTGAVPDLDVTHKFHMRIDRRLNSAHITSTISGDGFPNCESFLVVSASNKCMLGTHVRIGTAATQLPGGRALPMTNSMFQVDWTTADQFGSSLFVQIATDYTGDGSPQEIARYGQTTRAAWNALHLGRDASGDWLRQLEDNVPLGRQTIRQVRESVRRIFE